MPRSNRNPTVRSNSGATANLQLQDSDPFDLLTPSQQTAFHLLTAGVKPKEVARQVQVDRKTISRWLRENPRFIAAFNGWQHQIRQLGQARALSLGDLALDALEGALKAGDPHVAVKVAQSLGLLTPPPPGPQTPGEVCRSRARKSLKKQINIARDARALKHDAFPYFASTNTVYSIDDRIWLLMLERKKALAIEPPETRQEREETQRDEAEGDEERERIQRAIRYATEDEESIASPISTDAPPHSPAGGL